MHILRRVATTLTEIFLDRNLFRPEDQSYCLNIFNYNNYLGSFAVGNI